MTDNSLLGINELIEQTAVASNLPRAKVRNVVQQLSCAIAIGLQSGRRVKIPYLGVLVPKRRPEKRGRVPAGTDAPARDYVIPERVRVGFRASPQLVRVLNQGTEALADE